MNKPQKESQRLASWLADAVMTEMAKPEEEIDVEFVESCENLLNTLMGEKKLSDEEIEVRVNKIMESRAKPRVVPKKRKTAFIAIIAAVVFLLSGITVCATTPISQYILKALDLGLNESVTDGEITFINNGEIISYKSTEEFLNEENINIYCPEFLPYNAKINEIRLNENANRISIYTSDSRINIIVELDKEMELNQYSNAEKIEWNGIDIYIFTQTERSVAYFAIDNNIYAVDCDIRDNLLKIIYSIDFERIE